MARCKPCSVLSQVPAVALKARCKILHWFYVKMRTTQWQPLASTRKYRDSYAFQPSYFKPHNCRHSQKNCSGGSTSQERLKKNDIILPCTFSLSLSDSPSLPLAFSAPHAFFSFLFTLNILGRESRNPKAPCVYSIFQSPLAHHLLLQLLHFWLCVSAQL